MSSLTNFPSLAAIKDNATRQVLAAIIQHLRERGGEAGPSDEQFMTKAQVDTAIKEAK
jgi:hypothetical protein